MKAENQSYRERQHDARLDNGSIANYILANGIAGN